MPESPGLAACSSIVRTPGEGCSVGAVRKEEKRRDRLQSWPVLSYAILPPPPVFSDSEMLLEDRSGWPSFSQLVVVRGAQEMKHFSSTGSHSGTWQWTTVTEGWWN